MLDPPCGPRAWGCVWVLENCPLGVLICCWFFAWRRTLSALAPEEGINPLSSTPERRCGFSPARRKPRCGRWLDTPARCRARRASGPLEEGELGLQSPFLPTSILLPPDEMPVGAAAGLCQLLLRLPEPVAALGPERSPGAGVFAEGAWLFARRANPTSPLRVPLAGRSLPLPPPQAARAALFPGVCQRLRRGRWGGRGGCAVHGARQPPAAPRAPHAPGQVCPVWFGLFLCHEMGKNLDDLQLRWQRPAHARTRAVRMWFCGRWVRRGLSPHAQELPGSRAGES